MVKILTILSQSYQKFNFGYGQHFYDHDHDTQTQVEQSKCCGHLTHPPQFSAPVNLFRMQPANYKSQRIIRPLTIRQFLPFFIHPRLSYYKCSYLFNPQLRFPFHLAESTRGCINPTESLAECQRRSPNDWAAQRFEPGTSRIEV